MSTAVRPVEATSTVPGLDGGVRAGATAAGVGILLLAVLATFGIVVAVDGLVTAGDPARTARDVAGSELLFRLGIVSLLATVVVDVVVAWGLHRVLHRTSSSLSMLAAWFRLAYAATLLIATGHLVRALGLLDAPTGAFSTAQNQARALSEVDAFRDVLSAGLVLFGAHLLLVGYLAHRSGFVPRLLAALVCLAGAGYAFDGVASILSGGGAPAASTVTFLGELLLGVWLLARGRRLVENSLKDR